LTACATLLLVAGVFEDLVGAVDVGLSRLDLEVVERARLGERAAEDVAAAEVGFEQLFAVDREGDRFAHDLVVEALGLLWL
jgi:hypothetical protein